MLRTKPYVCHRKHEIAIGHRVHNHESKCAHLHGHNLTIKVFCRATKLDSVGRVIDFSDIKTKFINPYLEQGWDHKFLAWDQDPVMKGIQLATHMYDTQRSTLGQLNASLVWVPFNPTSENMANYLLTEVAPKAFVDTGIECFKVTVMETGKCGVTVELE